MIGIFIILIVNLMVCCEGFNPYSLSSGMGSSGIPGDWRGHVLRCLPPALMASITAGVSNSRMPSCREKRPGSHGPSGGSFYNGLASTYSN